MFLKKKWVYQDLSIHSFLFFFILIYENIFILIERMFL